MTGCQYPYGDGPFLFCGDPTASEGPYCAAHRAVCWVRPKQWAAQVTLGASEYADVEPDDTRIPDLIELFGEHDAR